MNSTVDLCFLCLTNNVNIKSILSQNNDGIVIDEKCRYVLNEYININPEVSYHICLNCLKTLDYTYNFKQMCIKNINKLNNYIDTLKNVHGPNKPFKVTLADLQRLENNDLTFCNESANESFPQIEVVLVKEEIADNYEENVLEEEKALHEDHEFTGEEKFEDINDTDTQYSAISYEDGHKENFLQDVKEETEFKDIHEEIYIKDEQLVCETIYSDSEDDSNDKLENKEANSPDKFIGKEKIEDYDEQEIHIKEEQLFEATDSDSEDISNDKLRNEEANGPEHTSSSYSEINETSNNSDKKSTKPHECNVCNKTYSRIRFLNEHKRVHTGERPYKCDVCNKVFSTENTLKRHKIIHTRQRPYECDVCKKAFSVENSLKRHKNIHTKQGTYECNVCNMVFSQAVQLGNHKRMHTDKKAYECDVCNMAFNHVVQLRYHKRIHIEKKSYECEVCEKTFYYLNNLVRHKRLHTDETPFKCDECNKKFCSGNDLSAHKLIHNNERPYSCDLCKKAYKHRTNLLWHNFSQHKIRGQPV